MQGSEIVIPDWFWIVFLFAVGCCVGSFLNVVIYRMPRDKSLVVPPSSCPACGKHIRFYDNIPLVSWLLLGRKCRYCKAPISPRYFVIELLTGLVFVGIFALYFRSGSAQRHPVLSIGRLVFVSAFHHSALRPYRRLRYRFGDVDYTAVYLLVRHRGRPARLRAGSAGDSSCNHPSLFPYAYNRRPDISQSDHCCLFVRRRRNRPGGIYSSAGHRAYQKKL